MERQEDHRAPGVALWFFPREVGIDATHLSARLLERDARVEARHRVRAAAPAHGAKLLQRQAVWDEEIGALPGDGELGGHHADDRPRSGAGREAESQHVGPTAEPSLPELVREHDHAIAGILRGGVGASPRGPHAEHLEDIRRDHHPGNLGGQSVEDHRHRGRADHPKVLECPRAFPPGDEVGRSYHVAAAATARRLPHGHEPIGLAVRQRGQHDRTHDAEDGGRGADAERERQQGADGEARRAVEQADAVAHVAD